MTPLGEKGGSRTPSPLAVGLPGTPPGKSYPTGREPHPRRPHRSSGEETRSPELPLFPPARLPQFLGPLPGLPFQTPGTQGFHSLRRVALADGAGPSVSALDPAQDGLGDLPAALAVLGTGPAPPLSASGAGPLEAQGVSLRRWTGSHTSPHRGQSLWKLR